MSKYFNIFLISFIIVFFIPICISQEENNSANDTVNNEFQNETEAEQDFEMPDPFANITLSNLIYLDDSNYTEEMKKYDSFYVLIYAPWCGHCHQFIPHYVETAEYCLENNPTVKFIRIDGSRSENATVDFQITGFPGIFFVHKGERFVYNAFRTKDGLLYFMKRKMAGDIIKINKLEELKDIKNIFNTSLILLSTVSVTDPSEMINKSFRDFAKTTLYIDFVSCLSKECYEKYGDDVILLKNFDEKENRYFANYGRLEEAKNDSVKNFVSIYGIETGAHISRHDINLALEFKKHMLFYIRNSSIPEHTKHDKLFKDLGFDYRPYNIYTFTSSPDDNELQASIMNAFSIAPEELPGIFYYNAFTNDPNAQVKLYSIRKVDVKKLNKNYVKQFVDDVKNGKIRRDLFSELKPEKQYVNGMKYVTGKTFDKDIIDKKKNVFVCLYEGFGNENEVSFLETFGNLTQKYQNDTEKNVKFVIMNINYNEPRDLVAPDDYDFPKAYLYTNAMDKKEILEFTPKNASEIIFEEFETFLSDKLNWNKDTKTDTSRTEEKKDEKKDKIKTEDL